MSTNKIKLKEIIYLKPPKNGEYYLIAIDGRAGGLMLILVLLGFWHLTTLDN